MKTKKFFGDTEIWGHGNFNICTTIPDLGTTHPLHWVGCEKNLETLELDVFNVVLVNTMFRYAYVVHSNQIYAKAHAIVRKCA